MWRRFSRESPSSTVAHFTDQAMFHRNNTQEFMDTEMNTEADHIFLRQEARRIDESGIEKADKARKETERLTAIGIQLDREMISRMTDQGLKDQLELHRRNGDKEVPKKSHMKHKADRLVALEGALDRLAGSTSVQSTS
jgi:hypothetical protein